MIRPWPVRSTECASSTSRGASRARSACCCSPSRAPTSSRSSRPAATRSAATAATRCGTGRAARSRVDLKHPDGPRRVPQLAADADVLVETFRPGVTDRLGIGFDALHARNPRLVYCSCPAYPEGHRLARHARATTRSCRRAAASSGSSRAGGSGRSSCTCRCRAWRAMFLVPTGILAALDRARGDRARPARAHVAAPGRAPLHDADLDVGHEGARRLLRRRWRSRTRRAVHQQMIFEVANDEWVHMSVMSGLTPTKSQDEHPRRRRRASNRRRYAMLSAEERGADHRRSAGPRTRPTKRDELVEQFRANNHAIEPIVPMEDALGGGRRRAASAARRQRHGRDGRRPRARARRRRSACRSTSGHAGRDPGAAPAAGPAQRRDPRRARLLATTRSRRSRGRCGVMHALEGVPLVDFGQYLAGPFGPMIIGDLGADVIKVEPVTGDGMRIVNQPFFGCQRGKRDIALNLKTRARARDRAEARRARRHRAPQHDRRRRRPARHRLRRLQGA